MGMDNKFLILNKSKHKVKAIAQFIKYVKDLPENDDSSCRISTYGIYIRQYGTFWVMESEFRNTVSSDLDYWLEKLHRQDLKQGTLMIIRYENADYVKLEYMDSNLPSDELFNVFNKELTDVGKIIKDDIPMDKLIEYFSYA